MTETTISPKARENRAYRAALRQGMRVVKSRRRDPNAEGYGLYIMVADQPEARDAAQARLDDGEGVSLDAIEAFLNWQDIFSVAPEGTENWEGTFTVGPDIDLGAISWPQNRVLVDWMGRELGWRVTVVNDGNPLDSALGGRRGDGAEAIRQAKDWARNYFR